MTSPCKAPQLGGGVGPGAGEGVHRLPGVVHGAAQTPGGGHGQQRQQRWCNEGRAHALGELVQGRLEALAQQPGEAPLLVAAVVPQEGAPEEGPDGALARRHTHGQENEKCLPMKYTSLLSPNSCLNQLPPSDAVWKQKNVI